MYYGNTCGGRAGSVHRVYKIRVSSLSQRVFVLSWSNLVNMLVCIISRSSFITSQIPLGTPELWPLNCPKLGFTLSKSKSFHPIFIKLGEYVGVHNVSTKFYNQPNPPRHSWIMALELSKSWISDNNYLLSKSNILLPKMLSLPLNLPQIRRAYFVSLSSWF